ncbi:MAG TPA: hypothetical protein VMY88_03270 [Acidimicrobiales bacterium]|nr:hypothetical protein [Acidimicrobiales bacterium]
MTPRNGRRNYPPLASAMCALLALLAVMPSALNLPQSNPSQTPEYAPVPPEDGPNTTPAAGNLASLSLAGSGSLGRGRRLGPADRHPAALRGG